MVTSTPGVRTPIPHLIGGCIGPHSQSGHSGNENNSIIAPARNLTLGVQPTVAQDHFNSPSESLTPLSFLIATFSIFFSVQVYFHTMLKY
jgi:hypothetical protein